MRGICRKVVGSDVVGVVVKGPTGDLIVMTLEDYLDQDVSPPVGSLPVCGEDTC